MSPAPTPPPTKPSDVTAFNRVIALVSLGAGVAIVAVCGWAGHRVHLDEFVFHRAMAQGLVVENEPVQVGRRGSAGGLGGTFYRAVVRFKSRDGRDFTVDDWISEAPPPFRVGESVTVIYDPKEPDNAMIDRGWENYLAPAIPAAFGLLMILAGLQRLRRAA